MRGIAVLASIAALAFGLQFAERWTGPLELDRTIHQYDAADLSNVSESYPRRVIDAEGYRLTLARPTKQVASQYWSIDEYVYSIIPPQNVISVSNYAYDHRYSNVYAFTESFHPAITTDPEVILKINPDLLLVSSSGRVDFTDLLRNAGVPVFRMFTDFTTLDEVQRTIVLTGHLTGEDGAADRVLDAFNQAVERATQRRPADNASPRILGYAGRYSYGDRTLFNDVVRAVGGVNVGAENGLHGYESINTEQIVRWNPEWIVLGAAPGEAETTRRHLMQDPAIALTTAAQRGHILVFDNQLFLPMSPFTAAFVDALSEALYGNHAKT